MKEESLKYRLKKNKMIRFMAYPVVNCIRLERYFCYQYSKEAKEMQRFKDTHIGERCFIIGNGPSLLAKDLEALKDEYCFAANRIYRMFHYTKWRPKAYFCVDSFVFSDIKQEIEKLEIPDIFLQMEARKNGPMNVQGRLHYINNYYPYYVDRYKRTKVDFSEDISHHFIAGETVVYDAIQMAVYMGFKEIYLLGVDHNYSKKMNKKGQLSIDKRIVDYFGNIPSNDYSVQLIDTTTVAYGTAKQYCDSHNIRIQNLTRGGLLEVFERNTLENVLGMI